MPPKKKKTAPGPAEWKTAAPAEASVKPPTFTRWREGETRDLPDLAREPKANVQVSERVEQEFRGVCRSEAWYEQNGGFRQIVELRGIRRCGGESARFRETESRRRER